MKLTEKMIVDELIHRKNLIDAKPDYTYAHLTTAWFGGKLPMDAFVVFGDNGEKVGAVVVYDEVLYLYVLPEYRNRGFMSRFLLHDFAWELYVATEKTASKIQTSNEYKDVIQHFCDTLGYEPVKRLRK